MAGQYIYVPLGRHVVYISSAGHQFNGLSVSILYWSVAMCAVIQARKPPVSTCILLLSSIDVGWAGTVYVIAAKT